MASSDIEIHENQNEITETIKTTEPHFGYLQSIQNECDIIIGLTSI